MNTDECQSGRRYRMQVSLRDCVQHALPVRLTGEIWSKQVTTCPLKFVDVLAVQAESIPAPRVGALVNCAIGYTNAVG